DTFRLQVGAHESPIALAWIAEATTTGVADPKTVTRRDRALAFERETAVTAIPHDAGRRARRTAEHAAGGVVHALDQQREHRRAVAGELDLHILPEAAAEAAGATGITGKLLAPDAQRRERLDDLHGSANDIGRKARGRESVPPRSRAHSTVDEEDRGVAPPLLAIAGDQHAQGGSAAGFRDDALAQN